MAYRIDPSARLSREVRRACLEQVDQAIACLDKAREDPSAGVHETRKSIKKLRALLRLVRSADRHLAESENDRFRDVARSIEGPREASALVEMLDRFIAEFPEDIAAASLDLIQRRLAARRDRIAQESVGLDELLQSASARCTEGRAILADNGFTSVKAATLAAGMKETLRDWKDAMRHAGKRGDDEDFHDLRKAVKAHWTHLGLLRDLLPGKIGAYRRKVEALGEQLGEFNDICVMRDDLKSGLIDLGTDVDSGPLRKLVKRKAKLLKAEALEEASGLYSARPRKLKSQFADAVRDARRARTTTDQQDAA